MSSGTLQTQRTQNEPGEEDPHPRTHGDSGAEIARLKRRLAASQDEVKELTQSRVKKPP